VYSCLRIYHALALLTQQFTFVSIVEKSKSRLRDGTGWFEPGAATPTSV